MATPEDHLGGHVNYLTSTRVILYTPGLVRCSPTQLGRPRIFIEHRGALIGRRRRGRWRIHERFTTRK